MNRRAWFQLLSALAAARAGSSQERPAAAAPRVTKDQVAQALKAIGLEFKDAEIDLMLPNLGRALNGFEALRKVEVPLDTEPAIAFHPGLPGRVPSTERQRFQPTEGRAPKTKTWSKIEDLAFLPVTALA